jgi:hypothetical protein
MFQPLRAIIRHYYVKKWQLNTLNCHFYERDLFLTTLSTTLLTVILLYEDQPDPSEFELTLDFIFH